MNAPLDNWLRTVLPRSLSRSADDLGLAVGGSYCSDQRDELSDLDLFVMTTDRILAQLLIGLPDPIHQAIPDLMGEAHVTYLPEYGIHHAVVSESMGFIDVSFLTPTVAYPSPLRRKSKIIWDPRGQLTALLNRLTETAAGTRERDNHGRRNLWHVVDYYSGAVKSFVRGDIVRCIYKMDVARNPLFSALASKEDAWWHATHGTLAAAGRRRQEMRQHLLRTVPCLSRCATRRICSATTGSTPGSNVLDVLPVVAYPVPISFSPPTSVGSLRRLIDRHQADLDLVGGLAHLAYQLGLRDTDFAYRGEFIEVKTSPRSPGQVKAYRIVRHGLVSVDEASRRNLADPDMRRGFVFLPLDTYAEVTRERDSPAHGRVERWFLGKPLISNAASRSSPDGSDARKPHPLHRTVGSSGRAEVERPRGPGIPSRPMRLVIARCTVDYAGRLSTHLPAATRLLLVKADGSVLVHADGGGYKPLNWMAAPCTLREEAGVWHVSNRGGETMTITIEEVLHDSSHRLGIDPGLVKDGVEKQLQALLAERCHALRPGLTLWRREYPTDIGPVDLLCRDEGGGYVAVEIKRRGEIDGVEQLSRYLERLQIGLEGVRGVFAALSFAPQARVLAAARGIDCVQVDYDALRGIESNVPTLF